MVMSSLSLLQQLNEALESCVIIDVETTGLEPKDNRIIEVATLTVRGGEPETLRSWLLNPEKKISQFITDLTGITNAHVRDCPTFAEVASEIMNVLTPQSSHADPQHRLPTLVGHNIAFDYSFLQHELLRCQLGLNSRRNTSDVANRSSRELARSAGDIETNHLLHDQGSTWWSPYTPPLLCTAEASRALIPRSAVGRYRLGNVAAFFSTPHRPHHRAAVDVRATLDVLKGLGDLASRPTN